jgi:epsilon-lactone hydrolase
MIEPPLCVQTDARLTATATPNVAKDKLPGLRCFPRQTRQHNGERLMSNTEIDAIREQLAASPRPTDMAARRTRLDTLGSHYMIPADVRVDAVSANGVAAEWTITSAADTSRVVMFLHGGGYVSGSLVSHRHMVAQLGREAHARTLALDYRLAPEYPFPAALEDTLAGYRFLLAQGIAPHRIALCGESAGGGLAIAAMISLRDAGEPLPACAWLSSPWTDLAQSGETMTTKAEVDPLIQKPYLDELAAAYLHGADIRNPLVSPIYADLRSLPPLLIHVGSSETLLDDSMRIAAVAGGAGVRLTLDIWPDMIHAFPLFYPQVAMARQALAQAGGFVHAMTGEIG